jgi:hypothetical protein
MKLWRRWTHLENPYDTHRRQPPAQPCGAIVECDDPWAEGKGDYDAMATLEEAAVRNDHAEVYLLVTRSLPRLLTWLEEPEHRQLLAAAPNVIVALAVTRQAELDAGAPLLARVPGRTALLVEPVGPIDVRHGKDGPGGLWGQGEDGARPLHHHSVPTDWIILRGGSAPLHAGWAEFLQRQALHANVPFAFLGWGPWEPVVSKPRHGDLWALGGGFTQPWELNTKGAMPGRWGPYGDVLMRPMGDVATGRLLNGVEYLDAPELAR